MLEPLFLFVVLPMLGPILLITLDAFFKRRNRRQTVARLRSLNAPQFRPLRDYIRDGKLILVAVLGLATTACSSPLAPSVSFPLQRFYRCQSYVYNVSLAAYELYYYESDKPCAQGDIDISNEVNR